MKEVDESCAVCGKPKCGPNSAGECCNGLGEDCQCLPEKVQQRKDNTLKEIFGPVSTTLKIKKLPHYGDLPELQRMTPGSVGIDLYAANTTPVWLGTIGDRALIPTGICVEIPTGFEGQVRPRSGLAAKSGITVLNTPGTIDPDYRGEIKVILLNTDSGRFCIERGMRIAQLVICPVSLMPLEHVDELSETVRDQGGYGSTGLK